MDIESTARSNPDLWRLAKYLYMMDKASWSDSCWDKYIRQSVKDAYYDKAAELMARIGSNGIFY